MKRFLFVVLTIGILSFSSQAQTKLQAAKINTPTVQCEMCKKRIEEYLKRIDGVTFVNVAVKKKETSVKFLTDRTNIETIKAYIANAGYNADEIEANPEAYKMLPKCCKKPEDGGGMPK